MQSLIVVERLFPLILSGEKTSTVRWQETSIIPGYMTYICDTDPDSTALVWVTTCTDLPLSEVAAFLGKETEWPDAILLEGMREHYPNIELTDRVQVVEHLTPSQTRKRQTAKA